MLTVNMANFSCNVNTQTNNSIIAFPLLANGITPCIKCDLKTTYMHWYDATSLSSGVAGQYDLKYDMFALSWYDISALLSANMKVSQRYLDILSMNYQDSLSKCKYKLKDLKKMITY